MSDSSIRGAITLRVMKGLSDEGWCPVAMVSVPETNKQVVPPFYFFLAAFFAVFFAAFLAAGFFFVTLAFAGFFAAGFFAAGLAAAFAFAIFYRWFED